MHYCYMDPENRLVAVVERLGNGRPQSPVRWHLRWGLRYSARGLKDSHYHDRLEAAAAVRAACPHAVLEVYNRRGERAR